VIFEEFATKGCRCDLVGGEQDRVAAIVDPIHRRALRGHRRGAGSRSST